MAEVPITPVGTLNELEALSTRDSYLPAVFHSCAPQSNKVKGCHYYNVCRFAQERYGGFRDHGPRNVGVVRTAMKESGEVVIRQDVAACFVVMKELELNKYANESKRATKVIRQEGEFIVETVHEPKQPNKSTNYIGADMTMVTKNVKREVNRFPRPGEAASFIGPTSVVGAQMLEGIIESEGADPGEELFRQMDAVIKADPEPEPVVVEKKASGKNQGQS